jgi:hypothetical protein
MMLDAEGIGYNKIAGFGIASLVLDAIGTGSSPNSGSGLAALVLDGVGVGILPGTGYAILAPLFVDLIGTGRGPGYGSGVASFSTSVSGYGDPARSGFGTAGLLTNIQTEILANGKGFLQPQEDVDCCCSGTGEADRCYCGVAFNTCSITWDCPFPRDSWNLPTIEPHMIRITRADDIDGEQTVIIESSSSTGTYPIPTNSNYYYRFQVCCLEPAEGQECDWVTVASGQINSIAVPCTLFPGGLAVYDINDSLGPTCTGQMRIYGAAARTPGSPLITELTIDGTVVATGSTWSALGCMPATVPATINACGTQPVCNPPSGPSELYIDRGYLTSSPDYKVVVKATNAAGQTRSCEMQMPCNFYYNYIRVEVPSWNGVDYDCTGSETLPSGFWSQINNADKVYTSLWRNRFNITLDDPVGGSYFVPQWYDCPSHNPIATGTMDWFWETEGTAKFFDSRVGQNKWVWFPFYYYARWTANIQVLLSLTQDLFGQHHAAVSLNTGTITEQLDYQIPNTLGLPGYYPTAGAVTSPYDNTDTVLDCADSPPGLIRSMKWLIKNPWKYANLADFFLDNDGPIFFEPPGVWTTGFTWSGPYPLYLDCLTRPFGADIVEVLQAELVHVP